MSNARAEGAPAPTAPVPAKAQSPNSAARSAQAPGGAVIGKPTSNTMRPEQQRTPPPGALPPQQQQQRKLGTPSYSSSTMPPQSRSPAPGAGQQQQLAPARTATPPIASSSLASFYSFGETSSTTDPSATFAETNSATIADTNANEEGQSNSSASAFYSSLAAQSTPTAAAATKKSPTPTHAATSSISLSSTQAAPPTYSSPPAPVPSIMATIAAKFVHDGGHPPIDLAASPKRMLVKEGYLQRQATFKNVSRYCYLMSDLFIVTEPLTKPSGGSSSSSSACSKLIMKSIVPLDVATVLAGKKPTTFVIIGGEKDLTFECSTITEADAWMSALTQAIGDYQSSGATKKIDVSVIGENLFTAIAKKDDQLLMYLLSERDEDPNQVDHSGMTPLHRCVLNGFLIGVTLLLSHEADMTRANADGKTPLHLAGLNDAYAILLVFLSRKPNLDSLLDMDGRSPLWDLVQGPYLLNEPLVAEDGDPAAAAVKSPKSQLSKQGRKKPRVLAAPDATDSEADEASSEEEEELLSPAEKDLRSREAIQRDSWKNLTECLAVMVDLDVDLESRDKSGRTLMMHLASIHSYESMQLLLTHNASLSLIDNDGCTVLHYAICRDLTYGRVDDHDLSDVILTVQLLLQAGVCPNLRDHHGNTPMHRCKSLPIAGCLIVHGARGELKNDVNQKAIAYFEEQAARGDPNDPMTAIKEAREQWAARPDTVLPQGEDLEANTWLGDEISDQCLLCSEKFSLTRRRHHCRRCGMLVCANCSSKKFSNPRKREDGLRACDGCFNFMAQKYVKYARGQRRLQAKRRAEEQELAADKAQVAANFEASHKAFVARAAEEEARIAAKLKRIEDIKAHPERAQPPPASAAKRASASGPAGASSSSSSAPGDKAKSMAGKTESTNQQMQQNRQMALERGEKLSRMEDKAAKMEEDAEQFSSLATQLKEKYKNSWF